MHGTVYHSPNVDATQGPPRAEHINKRDTHTHTGILFSLKKDPSTDAFDNMDGHCVKREKPVPEGRVLHESTVGGPWRSHVHTHRREEGWGRGAESGDSCGQMDRGDARVTLDMYLMPQI